MKINEKEIDLRDVREMQIKAGNTMVTLSDNSVIFTEKAMFTVLMDLKLEAEERGCECEVTNNFNVLKFEWK